MTKELQHKDEYYLEEDVEKMLEGTGKNIMQFHHWMRGQTCAGIEKDGGMVAGFYPDDVEAFIKGMRIYD